MPSLPPPRTTELFYDGAWHPVSVREADAVTITRGLTGKGTRAEPTAATMRLGNRHGEVSAHDPAAPLYGKIGRNTPIRVSVDAGRPYLLLPGDTTSALTCPDSPDLAVTDLDLRMEIAPEDYTAGQELASRSVGGQYSWALWLTTNGMQLYWYPDGTAGSQMAAGTGQVLSAGPGHRMALRVVLDVDTGSGRHGVHFYWAPRIDAAVWHLLRSTTYPGTTAVYDGTAGLRLGHFPGHTGPGLKGRFYAFELWDAATNTRKVALDFTGAVAGASSFTAPDGRVWTTAGAATLSNRHTRLEGEVPAWQPERHISGADSTVPITPAGILRRLGTGKKPLPSALRRAITSLGPIECWPLTDGVSATSGAPLVGTAPALSSGGLSRFTWGAGSLNEWTEKVLRVDTGAASDMTADCPPSATAVNEWAVDWVRAGTGNLEVMRLYDRGTGNGKLRWTVTADSAANKMSVWVDQIELETGSYPVDVTDANIFDGRPHHIRLHTWMSGTDQRWALHIDGVNRVSAYVTTPGTALEVVQYTALLGSSGSGAVSLGYVTYWGAAPPSSASLYGALTGHVGEPAGRRIARVCGEQGVPVVVSGDPFDTEPLGIQSMAQFLDVLEAGSKADMGLLLDRRDARALLYRTRRSLYTQAPTVTLDYAQGLISGEFKPIDGDRLTRNVITVKRAEGSEHTATLTTGRMSVQDPPAGVGEYEEEETVSLAADEQTVGQAWWRLHLGTHEGLRYPQVTVDLANPRAYQLAAQLLAADVGDILRLENLPAEYGRGPVDLLIRSYTEEIGDRAWKITFTCDPGRPWTVGVYDTPAHGKYDTAGSQLTTAATATDTTLLLTPTIGLPWTTDPAQFPIDLQVGGEVVRASAIRGVIADSFGRVEASGWGTAESGQPWTRSGGTASEYLVTGGVGVHATAVRGGLRATTVPVTVADIDLRADVSMAVVPAGGTAEIHLMARRASTSDYYTGRLLVAAGGAITLSLRKVVGGTETQLAAFSTGLTLGAGSWYTLRLSVQGTALAAKVWPRGTLEPPWQVTATDGSLTTPGVAGIRTVLGSTTTNPLPVNFSFDNVSSTPQQATVTRSVNGVIKPHGAGAAVSLAHPAVYGL
ncbi:hypothetical protein GCM10010497_46140 [Streptomyces cinereoruber]|uniref:LamG domain-containing protein n=1 Tax=Streptomyces cinereoruber TaxID=67260 RepID=A0AAV4KLV2_9ACTN|nr:hypothetical protein [Streptomyces cinereoruber]MBB4160083.1 hypothetical protein [Streptomyces cinereoruber]MBY8818306.1 hypothetical protein [Streptomyces cinereoruber]NIH61021.1 hypothetical protein [Streptomyces cinereoruber]QEV33266.1 hypothetical protein CP977_14740 [Streptomyces cinereoruber]GGR38006.1 hypothetical protein GCM10010497_46140 [Streptomyces cinereoruber]